MFDSTAPMSCMSGGCNSVVLVPDQPLPRPRCGRRVCCHDKQGPQVIVTMQPHQPTTWVHPVLLSFRRSCQLPHSSIAIGNVATAQSIAAVAIRCATVRPPHHLQSSEPNSAPFQSCFQPSHDLTRRAGTTLSVFDAPKVKTAGLCSELCEKSSTACMHLTPEILTEYASTPNHRQSPVLLDAKII